MPFHRFFQLNAHSACLVWRTDPVESFDIGTIEQLLGEKNFQAYPPKRRHELLSTRLALRNLLDTLEKKYTPVRKDIWGRPYLERNCDCISLSHCELFGVAALSERVPIGIDIQWPHAKLFRVKEKFLSDDECIESGCELGKLCVYWSAKEAIYKALGGRISSLRDIHIERFDHKAQGTVLGRAKGQLLAVHYKTYEGHVLAWCNASRFI